MIKLCSLVALTATALIHLAEAHTWIDCIDTDHSVVYDKAREWIYGGTKNNGICAGYMKNYPGRGDPDVNTKMTFKILMDQVPLGAPICTPGPADYSGWRHRLRVHPGQRFYYGYMDNGHVAKDKAGRGTYFGVYWTGSPNTQLEKTTDLTSDKLIDGQLHDFDDGNCGQSFEDGDFDGKIPSGRAGNDYPCVGEVVIPSGTAPGIYSLVWFWKFYNDKVDGSTLLTGGRYGGAAYTSCFEVEVLPAPVPAPAPTSAPPTTTSPPPVPTAAPLVPPTPTSAPNPAPVPAPAPTSAPSPVPVPAPASTSAPPTTTSPPTYAPPTSSSPPTSTPPATPPPTNPLPTDPPTSAPHTPCTRTPPPTPSTAAPVIPTPTPTPGHVRRHHRHHQGLDCGTK
ncbi:TPA: hypothetical protein N0F65_008354 [Lagenidium giganteum]|uniref:DUF7492 domain-containing protein n=1 Tax=Lagenidium giganteum TaxID=4803 RepID=A0AAV2YN94_9STRA|nr:TPA: hypothetical protein N0F65_008354 [Lagenidium giganteum]